MALETLQGVDKIDGFKVHRVEWAQPTSGHFIEINDRDNAITFRIQNGPIKPNGVNGCQVDTLIDAAFKIIYGLNKQFPCNENKDAMEYLARALGCLNERKLNREKRGVEGTNAE